jgi:hypothetical protein
LENKKNLFIVNSPLQLLNAIEAIHSFKLINVILVVVYNRSKNNQNQLDNKIKEFDFNEIIRFYPKRKFRYIGYVKLINQLKKYEYNYVFTGELEDCNFKIIVTNIKKENLFLLDEGTSTIVDYEMKIKQDKFNKYSYKALKYSLIGLNFELKDTINFFTYFDFEPLEGGKVIRNNLNYMKKDFKENNINYSDTLFFLGKPIFIFSNKNEFDIILQNVVDKYKNKKIVYIPHKDEKNTLKSIQNVYKNIEFVEINQPVEEYFLKNGIYPKHVISCSSTALFTIKILFEECSVEYIKIEKPNINLDYMKNSNLIYNYFEKSNILEFKK